MANRHGFRDDSRGAQTEALSEYETDRRAQVSDGRIMFSVACPHDPACYVPMSSGDALVEMVNMQDPLNVFVAGSDALAVIIYAMESRLQEMRSYEGCPGQRRLVLANRKQRVVTKCV
jgi:hypothetical protein